MRTIKKTKLLLASLFLLISNLAGAKWELVGFDVEENIYYVDLSTKRAVNNFPRAWALVSYPKVMLNYMSYRYLLEIDCKEERARVLSGTWFSEATALGKIVNSHDSLSPWSYIAPDSMNSKFMNLLCKK